MSADMKSFTVRDLLLYVEKITKENKNIIIIKIFFPGVNTYELP